jgi:hypothetical protein
MADEKKLSVAEAIAARKQLAEAKSEATTALVQQEGDQQLARVPEWAKELLDFDWKNLKPYQTALLLMQKTYTRYGDNGRETYRLSFDQALVFAVRCFEIGLSPISSEVWFNLDTQQVATTVEGRRKLARLQGMNFGPPQFTWSENDWPKGVANPCNFSKDIECTCTMQIQGWDQPATYTGRLSEWFVGGVKGQWAKRPRNMLQTRMVGQCLTFASGIGVSEMPDENNYRDRDEGTKDVAPQAIVHNVQEAEFEPPETPISVSQPPSTTAKEKK